MDNNFNNMYNKILLKQGIMDSVKSGLKTAGNKISSGIEWITKKITGLWNQTTQENMQQSSENAKKLLDNKLIPKKLKEEVKNIVTLCSDKEFKQYASQTIHQRHSQEEINQMSFSDKKNELKELIQQYSNEKQIITEQKIIYQEVMTIIIILAALILLWSLYYMYNHTGISPAGKEYQKTKAAEIAAEREKEQLKAQQKKGEIWQQQQDKDFENCQMLK